MPRGEFLHGTNIGMEGDIMPLQITVTDLGENNSGTYGLAPDDQENRDRVASANANPEYRAKASNRYKCVDGRHTQEELDEVDLDLDEYDPQVPGGQAVLETAIEFMNNPAPARLKQVAGAKTRDAIRDGSRVTVHSANGDPAGCAANVDMRKVLDENAQNIDLVVPTAAALASGVDIGHLVTTEQLTAQVVTGKNAADNDELWDVDGPGVFQAIVDEGGEPVDVLGSHVEAGGRVDLEEGAVKKAKLSKDLSTPEMAIDQFIVSLGQYKKDTFERFAKLGKSEEGAALQVSAAILYTIGISKHLLRDKAPISLVS
ncbi:MAG: hypothetical protein JWN82_14 [Candidatus Saccharibacteria bacterium]|nr:hypothetical protein [Candidatus Saccharibacteria bacterium]